MPTNAPAGTVRKNLCVECRQVYARKNTKYCESCYRTKIKNTRGICKECGEPAGPRKIVCEDCRRRKNAESQNRKRLEREIEEIDRIIAQRPKKPPPRISYRLPAEEQRCPRPYCHGLRIWDGIMEKPVCANCGR